MNSAGDFVMLAIVRVADASELPRSPLDHNSVHARPGNAVINSVSDTVTAIVAHRLGKVEAVRRLKEGLARTNGDLGLIAMQQQIWEGDTLRFRMRALGQTAAAGIEVLEERAPHRSVVALAPGEGSETPSSNIA